LGLRFFTNDFTSASSTTGPPAAAGQTPGGAKLGIGGAIDVHYWNNDVEAIVGDAFINQDSSFNTGGQSLDVEAHTTWENIGIAGIFGGVLSVLHARGRFCNILCRPRQPQVSPL